MMNQVHQSFIENVSKKTVSFSINSDRTYSCTSFFSVSYFIYCCLRVHVWQSLESCSFWLYARVNFLDVPHCSLSFHFLFKKYIIYITIFSYSSDIACMQWPEYWKRKKKIQEKCMAI
jgi:hypothetical protein